MKAENGKNKIRGLSYWMEKTSQKYRLAREAPSAVAVHDLRVAMRRCRSVISGLLAVREDPLLIEIDKSMKPVFKKLGLLRDVQVLSDLHQKLAALHLPHARRLKKELKWRKKTERGKVALVFRQLLFEKWRRLTEAVLSKKDDQTIPQKAFYGVALVSLESVSQLHRTAMRTKRSKAYHRLRIGIKKFRYLLENFLPKLYHRHKTVLVDLQDLLGEYHDLERFLEFLSGHRDKFSTAELAVWENTLRAKQQKKLRNYVAKTTCKPSFFRMLKVSLQEERKRQEGRRLPREKC